MRLLCLISLLILPFCASFHCMTSSFTSQKSVLKMANHIFHFDKKYVASSLIGLQVLSGVSIGSLVPMGSYSVVQAKEALPSLEKCFDAVRRELATDGESINRLKNDIASGNWDDVKLFTREYDAGFRGFVMKSAWKQMEAEATKKRGIEISNSFTFDLIALNKAARVKDTEDAYKRLDQVKQDLADFLALEKL